QGLLYNGSKKKHCNVGGVRVAEAFVWCDRRESNTIYHTLCLSGTVPTGNGSASFLKIFY
ncbi:MAG: hypothetical protein J6W60_05760, partial [Treponema sp.]|nr:hypothetical protein [Treponema sp.]